MSSDPVSTAQDLENGTPAPAPDFAALVESSEDAILSKDTRGVITSWNAAAERLYGYSAEQAVGNPISLIIPPERKGEEREILDRVLANERVEHYETERVRSDGRRVQVSLTVSPIRGEDDQIAGASVVARDISETLAVRRRAELLHRFTARLSRQAEPGPTIRVLLTDGCEALGADAATAGLVDKDKKLVALADSVGHTDEGLSGWEEFPLEADLPMCAAIRASEPVWCSTAEELTGRFAALREARIRFAALAVLPLELEGGSIGAVAFSFREPRHFSAEERAFMSSLAQQAAYALERARLYEAERSAREQLSFLARAGELLSQSLDVEQTLRRLAFLAVPEIADWCSVDLVEADGSLRNVVVAHADPDKVRLAEDLIRRFPPDPEAPAGVAKVIRTGEPELHPEIADELLKEQAQSEEHLALIRDLGFSSAMIVPLIARGRRLGAITLASGESGRRFGADDLSRTLDLARRAALAVDTSVLYNREHETALTLQRGLLPESLPKVDGVKVAARYLPAEAGMEVGGDWYDVIEPAPGRLDLVIGDVAGRGVEAAAVMGRLTMALRAYVFDGRPVHAAVTSLDELMKAFDHPQMATLFHLSIDLKRGLGRFVRAGHPPALLRLPDGEVIELEGEGSPPLGLVDGATFTPNQFELPPESMVLLYTDGLIERRELTITDGLERLKRAFASASSDAENLVQEIPAAMDAERVPDDIALLAVCIDAA